MNHRDEESRASFLRTLTDDEDDESTRQVYADWLEERGEYEEAERQRAWTAAKEWLVHFVNENSDREWGDFEADKLTSYDELIERGREAATDGHWTIHCYSDEKLTEALGENNHLFWKNFSIVTGIPVPEGEGGYFRCAC